MELIELRESDLEQFLDRLWLPAQREMAAPSAHTLIDDIRADGRSHRRSRLSEDDTVTYLARQEGDLVGYVSVEQTMPPPIFQQTQYYHVGELFVREPARGRGIGTELLETVERWAVENDCTLVKLNVDSGNEPARGLYKEIGVYINAQWNTVVPLSSSSTRPKAQIRTFERLSSNSNTAPTPRASGAGTVTTATTSHRKRRPNVPCTTSYVRIRS
jgi:GNAT superfamily N-acetyltransferase